MVPNCQIHQIRSDQIRSLCLQSRFLVQDGLQEKSFFCREELIFVFFLTQTQTQKKEEDMRSNWNLHWICSGISGRYSADIEWDGGQSHQPTKGHLLSGGQHTHLLGLVVNDISENKLSTVHLSAFFKSFANINFRDFWDLLWKILGILGAHRQNVTFSYQYRHLK